MKCQACDKPLSNDEVKECYDWCFDCHINYLIGRLGRELKMERIVFEDLIRKVLNEMDR